MTLEEALKKHEDINEILEQGYLLRDFLALNHSVSENISEAANINTQASFLIAKLIICQEKYEGIYKRRLCDTEVPLVTLSEE